MCHDLILIHYNKKKNIVCETMFCTFYFVNLKLFYTVFYGLLLFKNHTIFTKSMYIELDK